MRRGCECCAPDASLKAAFSEGETDFRQCSSCGLLLREVFPTPQELDAIYQQAYAEEKIAAGDTNQESGAFATRSYAEFIRRLAAHPAKASKVLDFGAGSGELVAALRDRAINADGLEFAEDARRFCLEQRGIALLSDLKGLSDASYGMVTMIEVIEHLTELQPTLRELGRLMPPGGTLLVTTPNRLGLRARREKGHWREATKKFHLFLFDRRSLCLHLEKAGFRNVRQVRFSPLQRPGLKFWLAARLPQLLGLGGTLCILATKPEPAP